MPINAPSTALSKATAIVLLAGLLAGCSNLTALTKPVTVDKEEPKVAAQPVKTEPPPPAEPAKKTKLYEWTGEGRSVTRIVVNVDEQKAHFYEGDKEVGWTTIASGISHYPTPVGSFSVQEKVANKESNLYGKIYGKEGQLLSSNAKRGKTPIPDGARFDGADMPYFLRLTGDGIGMHAGPIPRPGRPASHGCIRMPKAFAPIAFRHVGIGTQVSIVGKGPSYSAYLAQQRASEARSRTVAQATAPASGQASAQAPRRPAATAEGGQATSAGPLPQVAESGTSSDAAAGVGAMGAPSAQTAPSTRPPAGEAPKVPAVAHDPEPPVAPAIATRSEPSPTPAAPAPDAAPVSTPVPTPVSPNGAPHGMAQTSSQAPALTPHAQRPDVAPVSGGQAVPGSAHAGGQAAPPAVYYPPPQIPAYRAPMQAPIYPPPPGAPMAAQPTAPAQPGASAKPAGPEAKPENPSTAGKGEPKAGEPPQASERAETPPGASTKSAAPAQTRTDQGAG